MLAAIARGNIQRKRDKPRQGAVAETLVMIRPMAIGLIDWLDQYSIRTLGGSC